MKTIIFSMIAICSAYAGERFVKIDENNNAITDKSTRYVKEWKLVQDRKTNLTWELKTSTTKSTILNWEAAIEYCENLILNGYSDWRLPNQYEIKSLIDYSQSDPVVNGTFFPEEQTPTRIWTSTSESELNAWYLVLKNGEVFYNKKTTSYGVMCVRSDI